MVKLEEVEDEELVQAQEGPIGGEDDWDTDDESDASSVSSTASSDVTSETLYERLVALRDMLPPTQRRFLSSTASTTGGWVKSGLSVSGKVLWVVSTSLLLLGVPWALAYSDEQQMVEMEREMQQQQAATNLLMGGTESAAGAAKPAL